MSDESAVDEVVDVPIVPDGTGDTTEAPAVSDEEKLEQEKQHKESRAQKRFDKLTREKYELKGRVETLEKILQGNQPQPQRVQPEGRPTKEQFGEEADFIEAMTDWKIAQREKATKVESVNNDWGKKEEAARSSYDDYDEAIQDAADVFVSKSAIDAILDSPLGAEIRYYLAKHPDEAEATRGMSDVAAMRHIGKIEAKIEAQKTNKPAVKASSAPAPIKPVKTTGGAAEKDPSKMTFQEFSQWRRKQIAARR